MAEALDLIPLSFRRLSSSDQHRGVDQFLHTMRRRRSVREFAGMEADLLVVTEAIRTAGMAPSGANLQPWH